MIASDKPSINPPSRPRAVSINVAGKPSLMINKKIKAMPGSSLT
ncbi:MAG: hypothetical protein WBH31_12995 [Promethearchaeia archaeon]